MKVIYNNIIPFKDTIAINLFGVLFVRKDNKVPLTECDLMHERIHTAQMKELGYIFFYLLYFGEWLFNLCKYGIKSDTAYYMISFEREAFSNEKNMDYLKTRKHYQQYR